jgi:hypothetical protein
MDDGRVRKLQKEMLDELGEMKFCHIKVSPFEHEWKVSPLVLSPKLPKKMTMNGT